MNEQRKTKKALFLTTSNSELSFLLRTAEVIRSRVNISLLVVQNESVPDDLLKKCNSVFETVEVFSIDEFDGTLELEQALSQSQRLSLYTRVNRKIRGTISKIQKRILIYEHV